MEARWSGGCTSVYEARGLRFKTRTWQKNFTLKNQLKFLEYLKRCEPVEGDESTHAE